MGRASGRRAADDKLLLTLACGATAEAAARQAGVSERTVYNRLADPAHRGRLQAVRADVLARAAGALTAAATEAVRTLLDLQKPSVPPATRLGAARAVLELGLRVREAVDLEARIAALEAQVDASGITHETGPAAEGGRGGAAAVRGPADPAGGRGRAAGPGRPVPGGRRAARGGGRGGRPRPRGRSGDRGRPTHAGGNPMNAVARVRRLEARGGPPPAVELVGLSDPEWLAAFDRAAAEGFFAREPEFPAAIAAYRAAVAAAERIAPEVDPPRDFRPTHPRRVPVLFTWRLDPRFDAVWDAFERVARVARRAGGRDNGGDGGDA
jgi:hypothetical protein